MASSTLPPEFDILSRIADAQEPSSRELFQYALALLMVEDGKAEIVERRMMNMRERVTLRTAAGETFTLLAPDVIEELLAQSREIVREVLDEEKDRADKAGG
jgi:hypothetical protein